MTADQIPEDVADLFRRRCEERVRQQVAAARARRQEGAQMRAEFERRRAAGLAARRRAKLGRGGPNLGKHNTG